MKRSLTKRLIAGLFAVTALGMLPSITEAGDRYRGYHRGGGHHGGHHGYHGGHHGHHGHGHHHGSSWGFSFGYSGSYGYGYHRPYYYDTVVYRAPRAYYAPVYYEPYCAPRYHYPTRYYGGYDYYPSRSYFSVGFGYKQYR